MKYLFYRVAGDTPRDVHAVLPELCVKARQAGENVMVVCNTEEAANSLSHSLWQAEPNSFIAHGLPDQPFADQQPILLVTDAAQNLNQASTVLNLAGVHIPVGAFGRVCDVFLDLPAPVAAARERWKALQNQPVEKHFFQQVGTAWKKAG